jgi:HAE1 family hydrophobic/amphiphilic exporter-1
MKPLIGLAVKRPVSTLMCFVAVVIFGLIAAGDLPVEFLPEVQVPKLVVTAAYPGLPPEQIKELLTVPLEDSLSSVKGIRNIFSISRAGLCTLELEFQWGTDMTMAAVETREAIDLVYPSLPSESKKPAVLPCNPGEEPLIWVGVFPVAGDIVFARRLADREVKTRLQQAEGVGSVMLLGGTEEEIKVDVDLGRSVGRGITLDTVAQALAMSNYDFPAGSFKEGGTEFLVKTEGRLKSEDEFGALVVGRTQEGNRVRLADVASVTRGTREQSSVFQLNGQEGVALLVRRKGGESPIRVSDNVRRELESLKLSYGKDLKFTVVKDTSRVIASSVGNLVASGLLGGAIAFIVIFLFIRRLKPSLILIVSIPVSIVMCLLLMRVTGISLNTMSLGGLAMGVGMLVDNSVVVLENLERRLAGNDDRSAAAVIRGTAEMAGSTFGSTLTSLIVFVPVIFLPGIVGALFKDLALAVCYALCASFIDSITIVPVLYMFARRFSGRLPRRFAQRLRRRRPAPPAPKRTERKRPRRDFMPALEKAYRAALRFVLRRPLVLGAALAGIFALGCVMFFGLQYEFMPAVDSGEIQVTAALPPGSSIDYLARVGKALSGEAVKSGAVASVFVRAGGEEDDPYFLSDPEESAEKLHLTIQLKGGDVSAFRAIEELRPRLTAGGAEMSFRLPDDIIAPLLGVRGNETVLLVRGDDQQAAIDRAALVRADLEKSGLFAGIGTAPRRDKPGISLYPERDMLLRDGLSLSGLSNTLRGCLDGLYPSQYSTEGREIGIRVRLREEDRLNVEEVSRLPLLTQSGGRVALGDCVTLRDEKEFSSLIRMEKKDVAYMTLAPRAEAADRAARLVAETVRDNADVQSLQQSAFEKNLPRIVLIFVLAVFLLYLVLGAQFESFTLPLFMMISLPLSFSGIVIALVAFGKSINLSSCLGVLVLLGVVVNNSIILFENFKAKVRAGSSPPGAVYRGSVERLKPILITVLTTVTALIPVAIDPANKSSQSPMAVAILGGLTLSTLLTLFVTPLVFLAYFRRKRA